jgi:hypothetical protein
LTQGDFRPRLLSDGTLDPGFLVDAGGRWVSDWLEARLSGRDPYFPLNRITEEDPDALIVDLVKQAGQGHPATELISRGALLLLDTARQEAPKVPPYFGNALRICQQVQLPKTSGWFVEEIRALANDPDFSERFWGDPELVEEIVYAAIVQVPGLPTTASRSSWEKLLRVPRYTTLALRGLGPAFPQRLLFIQEWWKTCPLDERTRELDQMIFTALRTLGDRVLRNTLLVHQDRFNHSLAGALDKALQRNGTEPLPEYVPESAYASAIRGAGRPS